MPRIGRPGSGRRFAAGLGALIAPLAIAIVTSCEERDRLIFPTSPDPSQGVGPVTMIDQPNGADTTVRAGPGFFVNGRTIDPDGVDTVYFLVNGGVDHFQPFVPRPPADTVRFGVPITTSGLAGHTILVSIHGVDRQGLQGTTATRRIVVE